jgi:hypothetical protein
MRVLEDLRKPLFSTAKSHQKSPGLRDHSEKVPPEIDAGRNERSKMQHTVEKQLRFSKPEKILKKDQMAGAAYGKKLRQSLYHPEKNTRNKIHLVPLQLNDPARLTPPVASCILDTEDISLETFFRL